jgi:hypothetical protein
VQDDEAVEEVVVFFYGEGDLGPAVGGYGGRVEEGLELEDAVADVPRVGAYRGAEGVEVELDAVFVGTEGDCVFVLMGVGVVGVRVGRTYLGVRSCR